MSWEEVKSALFKVSIPTVLLCFALAMLNYLILSSYDYLGFRYLKIPKINYKKIYPSAFISYAFNLNLGALVGGLGFRYRIYSGWGVDKSKIPLIMLFSTLSNWLGYTVIISFILFLERGKYRISSHFLPGVFTYAVVSPLAFRWDISSCVLEDLNSI